MLFFFGFELGGRGDLFRSLVSFWSLVRILEKWSSLAHRVNHSVIRRAWLIFSLEPGISRYEIGQLVLPSRELSSSSQFPFLTVSLIILHDLAVFSFQQMRQDSSTKFKVALHHLASTRLAYKQTCYGNTQSRCLPPIQEPFRSPIQNLIPLLLFTATIHSILSVSVLELSRSR